MGLDDGAILPSVGSRPSGLTHTRAAAESAGLWICVVAALSAAAVTVATVEPATLLVWAGYLAILAGLVSWLLSPRYLPAAGLTYALHSVAALAIYYVQLHVSPEFGGGIGVPGSGTDDAMYFIEATERVAVSPHLGLRRSALLPYSVILGIPAAVIATIKEVTLPDLLLFNAAGAALIPLFVFSLTRRLSDDWAAWIAGTLAAICPLLWANGLVLLRDGWTAILFIGALHLVVSGRYLTAGLVGALLFYIRLGSGAVLLGTLAIIAVLGRAFGTRKQLHASLAGSIVVLAILTTLWPVLAEYMISKGIGGGGVFRISFVEEKIGEDRLFYQIAQQPSYVRLPLSFAYFVGAPFFNMELVTGGRVMPRTILNHWFALINPLFLFLFIKGLVTSFRWRPGIRAIGIAYLLGIVVLSQLSLQVRHKTMMMPLLYIVAGYGAADRSGRGTIAGAVAALSLIGVQILYLGLTRL